MEEDILNNYSLPKEVSSKHVGTQTHVRLNYCVVQV